MTETRMRRFEFRTCPNCSGYGVRDNGCNCTTCGGTGTGGLRSTDGYIGSGEIIIDATTRAPVSLAEFYAAVRSREEATR